MSLVYTAKQEASPYYYNRLLNYIHNADIDALIDGQKKLKNQRNSASKRVIYALLELNQSRRVSVFRKILSDLSPPFPHEVSRIENDLEILLSQQSAHQDKIFKLYKYLKRIDGAITSQRYTLAVLLTKRCLNEYYCYFITLRCSAYHQKNYGELNEMAVQVIKYVIGTLQKQKAPHSLTSLTKIALVTNSLSLTEQNIHRLGDGTAIDKGTALYYRENLNSIVRFLVKFL